MLPSTTPATRKRLLVFVIAYRAEKTLTWVLSRIPSTIFETLDCEIHGETHPDEKGDVHRPAAPAPHLFPAVQEGRERRALADGLATALAIPLSNESGPLAGSVW